MRSCLVIAEAEIRRRLFSRPFLFGTIVGALGLAAILVLPALLGGEPRHAPHAHRTPAAGGEALQLVAFTLVTMLYIAIVLSAQTISASVAEEKTSRIAEILVAAVDPTVLLVAKIAAAFVTAAAQLVAWALAAVAIAGAAGAIAGRHMSTAGASDLVGTAAPPVLAAFFVALIVGLAQFSLLFAAAASLINRTEDLGSVIGPMMLPVLVGFFGAQFAVATPNAPAVVALSFVPLVAPFVMFARVAIAHVAPLQLALALGVNVVAVGAIALLAGRVYRVGLLLYGRPPSLRQIAATLRG